MWESQAYFDQQVLQFSVGEFFPCGFNSWNLDGWISTTSGTFEQKKNNKSQSITLKMLQYGDLEGPKKGLNIFDPNFVNRAIKALNRLWRMQIDWQNFFSEYNGPLKLDLVRSLISLIEIWSPLNGHTNASNQRPHTWRWSYNAGNISISCHGVNQQVLNNLNIYPKSTLASGKLNFQTTEQKGACHCSKLIR